MNSIKQRGSWRRRRRISGGVRARPLMLRGRLTYLESLRNKLSEWEPGE